jgi:hypothetical protein
MIPAGFQAIEFRPPNRIVTAKIEIDQAQGVAFGAVFALSVLPFFA